MNIAEEFKEVVKYAWESAPVRMVENGSEKSLKALKAYVKMHPGVIDNQLEKYPGYTLLHVACSRGNYGAAEILIAHGADIKQKTGTGATPLTLTLFSSDENVSWQSRKKLADLLLSKGADIEARFGEDERTLLQDAFFDRREEEAKYLIAKGADPKAAVLSRNGMSPLMDCLLNVGSTELLDLGLAHGMDPQAENRFGMTPLFYAKDAQQALKLVAKGADPAHVDHDGRGALSLLPPDEAETVRRTLAADARRRNAATEQEKAREDAGIDAACHTPVTAEAMKPLKLAKRRRPA